VISYFPARLAFKDFSGFGLFPSLAQGTRAQSMEC